MTFDGLPAALAWLDSHTDFEAVAPTRTTRPGLERMEELMGLAADPQRTYPTIHVTGTNGKGSTAAIIAALLGAQGLTVGTYSSPNLERVNERICRNGEMIDDASFVEVLESLARLEGLLADRPTRFELLTAAAYLWFADEAVDVGVIEVGIGGTWDCTNVIDATVSVVTNISYDHTEVLGPTLEGIATDKAGIFKSGGVAVIGEDDPGLVGLLRDRAREAGSAEVWVRNEDFSVTANRLAVGGRLVDLRTPGASYGELLLPLHGAHQADNAACALAAAEAFFSAPLADDVVEAAFSSVRMPGRLEVLGHRPLVIVDGAHNAAGMAALAASLSDAFEVAGGMTAVIGLLTGRDPAVMLEALMSAGVRRVVVCTPRSPRAQRAVDVADVATSLGLVVEVIEDPAAAVTHAVSKAGPDEGVVVCGSLYMVADARSALVTERQ